MRLDRSQLVLGSLQEFMVGNQYKQDSKLRPLLEGNQVLTTTPPRYRLLHD
ncbi:hypothetical protein HanXRQr2_Chr13g0572051 [Helianthus annuus]|uniref:Uncharacterized protein n=1 Tax=Helianthus annuus TaxID=4232 RepID=A0A9K3EDS9_HELAN|nr:hypothetical protein HanXRQr2_Chr13g0572051 [Helianthus annuus]